MYIDIAVGLVIGFFVALGSGGDMVVLMLFAVFATLAPDIDFIVWLIRNRFRSNQFAHEHRDLFHLPLIVGVGGALLIGSFYPAYGLVWGMGTLAHFIHDTLDGGWGIQWLHPFSRGYFTLASYSPKRYFRNREEQRVVAAQHGNPYWLE